MILFDFSLARAPLDNIRVGTSGYTDPFLVNRKPQRWDLAAERYSVGVTLYEMTLGEGVLPQWGDGKSDPALTDDELVLDAEKFDPSVREGLVEFFLTALHRDPARRFDNAEEMLRAWQQVFEESEQRKIKTPGGEEVDLAVTLEQADLKTPIAALGLSTRARNALERAEVLTVRNLLEFPIRRHPHDAGSRQPDPAGDHPLHQRAARTIPQRRGRAAQGRADSRRDHGTTQPRSSCSSGSSGVRSPKKEAEWNIRAGLLGTNASDGQPASHWPSQTDIADAFSVTRARIGQVLTADRTRWGKDPLVTSFRHELCEQIQRLGGVVTVPELIDLTILLASAGQHARRGRQQRLASAVARAAVETEGSMAQPRFQLAAGRRQDRRRLLAGTGRLRRQARPGRRRSGGERSAAAAVAGLSGTLRSAAADAAARLSALQQRTAPQAGGGDEQDRRRLVPAGTLPPWHGGGTGLAAGHRRTERPGPGRGGGGLHHRADPDPGARAATRGRAAAGSPGTRRPAASGSASMSSGIPRPTTYPSAGNRRSSAPPVRRSRSASFDGDQRPPRSR